MGMWLRRRTSVRILGRGVVTVDFGGPWSEKKLACVEEYAKSYLTVMKNQPWATLHYVDAFAGCGRHQPKQPTGEDASASGPASLFGDDETDQEEACEFIEGSPIRVMRASLGLARGFDRFVFMESDPDSCARLQARVLQEFGDAMPPAEYVCDDANIAIAEYLASYDSKNMRSLVFLDPFGCEVRWESITRLAATHACDVWYLFPLSGVFRMLPRSGKTEPSWEARLDAIFGTHDWRAHFYAPSAQGSLFDDIVPVERNVSSDAVIAYVVARLNTVFAGVAKPAILRNRKNSPMFALVFAVSNPSPAARRRALDIANHLMRRLNEQT